MLDVTDQASIDAAAAELGRRVGSSGLAGLVNNAGISVLGPVEALAPEDWRRQFDVNFFGQMAVTRAMLPLLRAGTAAGRARIVMISSIAGRVGQPVLGPYCASKFALESASDSLRLELRAQRIGVSVVQPGAIKSEIWRKGQGQAKEKPLPPDMAIHYGLMTESIRRMAEHAERVAIPAVTVARVVERCLTARRAPVRVLVGTDAKVSAALKAVLPTRGFDWLLAKVLRIGA
jgi:NAD(P)-dependent dehydrogenase (short-subunit alcohol dehydrogenase family)